MARIYKLTSYVVDLSDKHRDISGDIFGTSDVDQVLVEDVEVAVGPEFEWSDDHPLNSRYATKADYEEWFNKKSEEPCDYYRECVRKVPRYSMFTGKIDYYTDEPYSICLGTKECDECSCGGWKSRCERNK